MSCLLVQREEPQSLAQKLQRRVSSVESLFRGSGRAEGLFRSGSRESLVRSPSRDSLTPLGDNEVTPAYDPPSDIESEAEDSPGNAEALSKEQLLHRLHRVEKSLANYRGKYSEVLTGGWESGLALQKDLSLLFLGYMINIHRSGITL